MPRPEIDPRHALDALHAVDPGCTRDEWHAIGRAAIAAGLSVEDLIQWSSQAPNFKGERDVRAAFRGVSPHGKTGPGTLWRAALQAGWKPPADGEVRALPLRAPAAEPLHAPPLEERPTLPPELLAQFLDMQPAALAPVAVSYLQARCCALPPLDGDLRFHPALRHPPTGYTGPALVGLVTDAATRQPLTWHRTWIAADGTKAQIEPARMLLGGYRKAGGVIRLWPDEGVTLGLGVAEGIETALSLAHAFAPVWAAIDAGNLGTLPVLPGIESLLIAADHDPAGIKAARQCAERWAAQGREVGLVLPPEAKTDLNDLARREAA